ncbi:hypothetical protein JOB18_028376 [Solea senegalensis]|uniref:Uncharacterized protein n=1 Tax=Solea senegalensis TaxID=28829 RepID=A0AAV6RSA3_SOLSE|nr:hypothetical protein JOB18_028376 [Solea senegalensis]
MRVSLPYRRTHRHSLSDENPLMSRLSPSIITFCCHAKQHLSPFLPSIHQLTVWAASQHYGLPHKAELFRDHFVFVCVMTPALEDKPEHLAAPSHACVHLRSLVFYTKS